MLNFLEQVELSHAKEPKTAKQKPSVQSCKALKTLGFLIGTPDGIRTHDLQSRSFNQCVLHCFILCRKSLKFQGFFNFAFSIVLRNNSTFRNEVEFLLNYFLTNNSRFIEVILELSQHM